jgi:hypothetical protein
MVGDVIRELIQPLEDGLFVEEGAVDVLLHLKPFYGGVRQSPSHFRSPNLKALLPKRVTRPAALGTLRDAFGLSWARRNCPKALKSERD